MKSEEYQWTRVVCLNIERGGREEEEEENKDVEGKLRSRDIGDNRRRLSILLFIRQEQKYQYTTYEEFNLLPISLAKWTLLVTVEPTPLYLLMCTFKWVCIAQGMGFDLGQNSLS